MARVRNGVAHRKRVKKVLKQARGYRESRSKWYRIAKQSVMKGWEYAYRDRRRKKRDFRRLWVSRINAAVRQHGLTYSQFIYLLYQAQVQINRKALANMTVEDPQLFAHLVARVRPLLG